LGDEIVPSKSYRDFIRKLEDVESLLRRMILRNDAEISHQQTTTAANGGSNNTLNASLLKEDDKEGNNTTTPFQNTVCEPGAENCDTIVEKNNEIVDVRLDDSKISELLKTLRPQLESGKYDDTPEEEEEEEKDSTDSTNNNNNNNP
jgi:hypothetical protein